MVSPMNTGTEHSVGEAAALANVSVRTLHYYDEIGLLRPSGRTHAGYRRYDADDLARLGRILFYRELDFGLDDIARLLDSGGDPITHLQRQHAAVTERIERLRTIAAAIERELEEKDMQENRFEVFGPDYRAEWEDEAAERWGETDAYRESARRTRGYTKADWTAIQAESTEIEEEFAAALRGGHPADGPVARQLAERHRQHISRWFYDCSPEMHRGLAEMYVADDRFRAHYDDREPGLAQYVHDSISS